MERLRRRRSRRIKRRERPRITKRLRKRMRASLRRKRQGRNKLLSSKEKYVSTRDQKPVVGVNPGRVNSGSEKTKG